MFFAFANLCDPPSTVPSISASLKPNKPSFLAGFGLMVMVMGMGSLCKMAECANEAANNACPKVAACCLIWQASAGPVRAEELFRDLYQMGAVQASTKRFWDHQLAYGQRHVTNIHLEVCLLSSSSMRRHD